MKKLFGITTGLVALGLVSAASAQTISPSSGSGTISSSAVVLSQSTTATCTIGGTYSIVAGKVQIVPTMSGGLCNPVIPGLPSSAIVRPYNIPWLAEVNPGSTTTVRLTVGATTVLNKPCYGTVVVPYDSVAKTITFGGEVLPPVTAGDPSCTLVSGTVTLSPGVIIL